MQFSAEEDRRYTQLLNKPEYRDRYRICRGDDRIYSIQCRNGDIEPYTMTTLCCFQSLKSKQAKTWMKKKLPNYCKITQNGDTEMVFVFPLHMLDEIADIVHVYRRHKLSPEQRARKAEQLQRNLEKYRKKEHCLSENHALRKEPV